MTMVVAVTLVAAPAPGTGAPAEAGDGRLVVADTAASRLYVYSVPEVRLLATLENLKLDLHSGTVALPDGRLLLVDALSGEFVVLQVGWSGTPEVVGRVRIPTPTAWSAVDPQLRYFVASSFRNAPREIAAIVDLTSLRLHQREFDMKGDDELHPMLGGHPLTLYVSVTGELHAYPLADVLADRAATPAATARIGTGTHGPVIAHGLRKLALTTHNGLEVVDIAGPMLGRHRVLPWDASGRSGGRNTRPRLAHDGRRVYGAVWPSLPAERWAERQNDIHVADLEDGTVRRLALAAGIVPRVAISEPYALFFNVHPAGDAAYVLDVRPGSETFQRIVARIPLPALVASPPIPGESPAGRGSRSGAITPDGRWAFVSQGGDGKVAVIDTAARRVVRVLSVPTPLRGGGYMVALQPGMRLVDTVGR
ncbi:MAG: hypothetical protein QN174_00655 [Armatimonadota bacterium]|nr:hypothetical protein [Armatimonadota bacterium]MDR7457884.1 hypothetical protein [Armatimonadota bacterium]MDR7495457.1 hypothetical protein [Armatimonadota bacterium]MDR7510452.1 hypothetical protein [Armatimonadota bacterium]